MSDPRAMCRSVAAAVATAVAAVAAVAVALAAVAVALAAALAWPTTRVAAAPGAQAASVPDHLLEVIPQAAPLAGEFVPDDIAVRPDGGFYVLDRYAARIQRFDADGQLVGVFGGFGTAEGQFLEPTEIALAPDGSVAVLDPLGLTVQRFEADGTWRSRFRLPPGSIAYNGEVAVSADGTTWVAGRVDYEVWERFEAWLMRFDAGGRMLSQSRLPVPFAHQFVAGLSVTADGGAFVVNTNGDVLLLNADATVRAAWSTVLTGDSATMPVALATASDGTLWVADRYIRRLRRFTADGNVLEDRPLPVDEPALFDLSDFALGNDGRLWTTEIAAARLNASGGLPIRTGRVRVWDSGAQPVAEWRRAPSNVLRVAASLTAAAGGGIWAIDRHHGILRFDDAGRIAATWPITPAWAIADLGDGRILVADGTSPDVRVFGPDGQLIGPLLTDDNEPMPVKYAIAPMRGGQAIFFRTPEGLLQRYDPATRRLETVAAKGTRKGENASIADVAALDDGAVVVTDPDLGRLQSFGPAGTPPRVFGFDPLRPCDPDLALRLPGAVVAAPDGKVIVGDREADRLLRFRRDGVLDAAWGDEGAGPGQFRSPEAMAFDEDGTLWVEDSPLTVQPSTGWNPQILHRRLQRFGTAAATRWRAEAFADAALGGEPITVTHPAAVRIDAAWLEAVRPLLADPPATWSARFTRPLVLEPGRHRFTVRAAGGVRLWVGDKLLLDRWTVDAVSETVPLDVYAPATFFTRLDHRPAGPPGAAADLHLDTAVGPIPPASASPTPPATVTLLPLATNLPNPTPSFVPTRRPPSPNAIYLPRVIRHYDVAPRTPEPPLPPAPAPHLPLEGVDALHYDIYLTLQEVPQAGVPTGTPAPLRASAVTTVTVGLTADSDRLALNAEPLGMTMRSIDIGGHPAPTWAWVPGRANRFGLTGTRLVVPLPARAAAGTVVTATFRYDIALSENAKSGYGMMSTLQRGRRVVQSRNSEYYARYWLPSHDHPSDAATADITLNLPESIVGASNGELVADTPDDGRPPAAPGRQILRWRQAAPIQTYLIYVLMGDLQVEHDILCYGVVDGKGVVQDCAVAQRRLPYSVFWTNSKYAWPAESASEAVAKFSALFGDYPHPKLAMAAVQHPYSMEYTSLLSISDPRSIGHELVHQWWGADVLIDGWSDFWLKEGITDYFDLYVGELGGVGARRGDLLPCHPSRLFQPRDVDGMALLEPRGPDQLNYAKAAATIHDLRWRIALAGGLDIWDEPARLAFEGAFRDLYQSFRGRALTAEAMAEHFGRRLGPIMRDAGMTVDDATAGGVGAAWLAAWKGR